MTFIVDRNVPDGAQIAAGLAPGWTVVHKFGRVVNPGSTYVPVAIGSVYQMVQPAAATTLRVKAGNVNDDAGGSGATEVTLEGLDATGAQVTEAIAPNGTSAGTASSNSFIRLYRAWVSASGTYATSGTGSHAADIVIENGAGGTDWLTIDSTDYPRGQSEVACYSVPTGQTAYISSLAVSIDSTATGTSDLLLMRRTNLVDAAADYDAAREVLVFVGIDTGFNIKPVTPWGGFAAGTDLFWLTKASANTTVEVDFEILLWDGT